MTLTLYIARRFLKMFGLVFGVFAAILLLIDVIDQLRKVGVTLGGALYLSLLNVPESLYQILPLIMILTAIALFLGLARSSELVVVRASGRSGLQFLLAPVVMALLIGAVAVAVFNPLVAATSKAYDRLAAQRGQEGSLLSLSEDGLWMRQGNAAGQSVIKATRSDPGGTTLQGVTVITFNPEGTPTQRIEATSAQLLPGEWVLHGAKRWSLTDANPEQTALATAVEMRLPTDLTQDRLRDGFGDPSSVAFWALPSYIKALERAGFSARSYQVWTQMELALPVLLAAMVLIAAGFTMRHARFGKTGQMVLLALLGGFLIFFLRNFAQVLGQNGQIPILLAAWSPPIAATFLALGLLLHLEDG
ncbi:LPS export ABC transporter permease LptG [Cypionkella sp.]|uniref:LPS export ABC transporter permease LptG n=1 Tax=Cypionkella sp. TaxID=2811411 RepID=UPI00271D735C|nr:LPS export ABC transporter permease LptG [Cypionkella sp.]MDO8983186.1 LPS export ABC transporter permease LptG [Cypionkella sp.]MDP1577266.1 LPS export ABC transporter permease LptG [Cypionkella sp.]MDP2049758.1 LPS export ABC transporter permease LptG [Cypionkella sp.]